MQTKKEGIFFYEEKIDYGSNIKFNGTIPQVYDDSTIVIRVIRTNVAKILTHCGYCTGGNRIRMSGSGRRFGPGCLCQIDPIGMVDEKDIDLKGIDKKINYCSDGLKFYLIRKDQILVTYYNNTNNNTDDHYEE